MRSIILTTLFFMITASVTGQELLWQFVNAAGFEDGDEISVYWTLGESLSVETIGEYGSLRVGFMAYTAADEPDASLPTIESPVYSRDIDLSVFPNPTEDYFNISTEQDGIHTIKAFGIDGTQLLNAQFESRMSVDISSWASGTYTISVIAPSGEFNTTKLIKL